jgi:hypothetical protein
MQTIFKGIFERVEWLFFVVQKKTRQGDYYLKICYNFVPIAHMWVLWKEIGLDDNRASMEMLLMSNEDKKVKKFQNVD